MLDDKEQLDFCLRDYEMKVEFLKGHYSRLWTRFNFFLTIELALYGFLGYLLFDPDAKNYEGILFPILFGLGVSIIWCFVGYQDRALVKMYQYAVEKHPKKIACIDGLEW